MIRLPNIELPDITRRTLIRYQDEINSIEDYAERVRIAANKFKIRNTNKSKTFQMVKSRLSIMCSGAQRCGYCEDSCGDEVEHIKPKSFFPESTFVWENYLYACGTCNAPKNNYYALFERETNRLNNLTRRRGDPLIPPPLGDHVLINPRAENPLDFMTLDLIDTFYFQPTGIPESREYERARYTIEMLHLNDRDYLCNARKEAYCNYLARLREYISQRDNGESNDRLTIRVQALKRMAHPSVWREIQRQRETIHELLELFGQAPEAMEW